MTIDTFNPNSDIQIWSDEDLLESIMLAYAWNDIDRATELLHELKRREEE